MTRSLIRCTGCVRGSRRRSKSEPLKRRMGVLTRVCLAHTYGKWEQADKKASEQLQIWKRRFPVTENDPIFGGFMCKNEAHLRIHAVINNCRRFTRQTLLVSLKSVLELNVSARSRCLFVNTSEFRLLMHISGVPRHSVCRSVTQYDLTRRILGCGENPLQDLLAPWHSEESSCHLQYIMFAASCRQEHLFH